MKISQKLPQFSQKTLLIVAGRQSGDLYFAHNGEIDKIDSVRVETPTYSDKEGFFMRVGRGMTLGRWSVLEEPKEETLNKFLKELKEKIQNFMKEKEVEEIYLFSSDFVRKGLPRVLSSEINQKIVGVFNGNFLKQHPFELIKKIKIQKENSIPKVVSESVKKILNKKNMENNNKILKALFSSLTVFIFFAIIFSGVSIVNKIKEGKFIGKNIEITNTISTSGYGEIFVRPDTAIITLSIINENINIEKSLSDNVEKSNKVIEFLKKSEIDEKDIKTTAFNVYPRYEYSSSSSKRTLVGYEVRQSLEVKIRDIEKIGSIITGVTKAGAEEIFGPNFIVDNEELPKEEARKIAIDNAEKKAEKIAKQLGVKLGRIVGFNEGGNNLSIMKMKQGFAQNEMAFDSYGAEEEIFFPDIQMGENIIRVDVTLIYETN